MGKPEQYLENVRSQYEELPYPPRIPEDERKRLNISSDILPWVNQVCFGGRQSFNDGFRVLVAGGGTGDATIFLAEQLRFNDAEVVYLDISAASMKIAKKRAEIRGLTNIKWVHASILDLAGLALGEFDYVTCSGVLHHLEDPEAGLAALAGVLKNDGAMQLMVYAKYGRTALYQVQDLMRLVNSEGESSEDKINNTRKTLKSFGANSWYKMWAHGKRIKEEETDVGLFDMYLHEQDRAYTIGEVYDFLASSNLKMIGQPGLQSNGYRYRPESFVQDAELLAKIKQKSLREQQGIAEILAGDIDIHLFFAAKSEKAALSLAEEDVVPYFYSTDSNTQISTLLEPMKHKVQASGSGYLEFEMYGRKIRLEATLANVTLLENMDGEATFDEILQKVCLVGGDVRQNAQEIMKLMAILGDLGLIYLRKLGVPNPRSVKEMMKAK